MVPRPAGKIHERALSGNHRDAVRLAEVDSVSGRGSLAAATEHPDAFDAGIGAIPHQRIRYRRRRHEENPLDRRLNLLQPGKAWLPVHFIGVRIHRHCLVSPREELAKEGS